MQIAQTIQERQRYIQKRYQDYCKQHGANLRAHNMYNNIRPPGMMVVDKHKLLYCRIAKVGYSNWKRLILLMNSNLSTTLKASLHSRTLAKYSPELAQKELYTTQAVQLRLKTYFKMAFVRHPLDRLLSAYEDKFGKHSTSRAYYLKNYGAGIVSLCRNGTVKGGKADTKPANVTFSEFMCYVSRVPYDAMDWHWRPYWSFCQLCQSAWRYDFIGEYEHIGEEANHVLDVLGVTHLRYPLAGYRTDTERRQRFITAYNTVSTSTIDAVWRRYQVDFDMFGYKLYPNFWYTD